MAQLGAPVRRKPLQIKQHRSWGPKGVPAAGMLKSVALCRTDKSKPSLSLAQRSLACPKNALEEV
jgi:hypothetical protein